MHHLDTRGPSLAGIPDRQTPECSPGCSSAPVLAPLLLSAPVQEKYQRTDLHC